ncbi:hypothetical protein Br6_05215 [Rhodococcus sp. Br-6]|nr:hypothetical protein Br6_05215 [Rhodococcus sp. Br-6]
MATSQWTTSTRRPRGARFKVLIAAGLVAVGAMSTACSDTDSSAQDTPTTGWRATADPDDYSKTAQELFDRLDTTAPKNLDYGLAITLTYARWICTGIAGTTRQAAAEHISGSAGGLSVLEAMQLYDAVLESGICAELK